MFKSRTAKRFRAVAIALGVTLLTNYAISFAARAGEPSTTSPNRDIQQIDRSGGVTPGYTPKPKADRSGGVTPGYTPKPKADRSGGVTPGYTPRP